MVTTKNVLKLKPEVRDTDTDSVLKQAIDSMTEGFAYFGPDDRLVFCNQAYLLIHPLGKEFIRPGVLFEDIIKTNIKNGHIADAKGREKAYIRERLELHRNPQGPIFRRLADGSTFVMNESRTPDGGTLLTLTEVTQLTQIEEELRASEALLLRMLDASPVSVQITTREGEHLYNNKRALEILGFSAEELDSINAVSYYAEPAQRKRMKDALYKTGETPPTEVELVKPDGTHYFVIMTSTLLDFEGKKAHLTYQYDISERKEAEKEISESREMLRALADNLPEFISLKDTEGRFQFINKRFEDWTGTKQKDVIGKTVHDIYDKKQADEFAALDRKAIKSKKILTREIDLPYPDGKTRTVVSTRFPVLSLDGEVVGLGTVNYDLTERKKMEKALRDSEGRLRDAVAALQEGFAFYDADDRLVLYNDEYLRLHPKLKDIIKPGMRFEDMIRANVERGLNADAIGREKRHVRERLKSHRNPKGPIIRTTTYGTSYLINEGRTPDGGFVVTETDITEQRKLEEQIKAEWERYFDALESIEGGVALFDADDRFVLCNSTYRKNFKEIDKFLAPGFTYKEILSAYAEKGLNTEARENPKKYVRERLARHKKLEPSTIQMVKTGKWFLLREYRTSDGGTLITRTDVTDQQKLEEQAKADHARLKDTLESVTDGVALFDAKDRLVLFNTAYYESLDELHDMLVPGTHFKDIVRTSAERYRAKGKSKKEIAEYVRWRMALHKKREPHIFSNPEKDTSVMVKEYKTSDGGAFTVRTDVTDLKRAEAALRESEERHRDLIQGSVMGIVIDRKGKPLFANQAYADLYGYDIPDDILALGKLDILYAPESLKKIKKYRIDRLNGEEAPDVYEFEGIKTDGTHIQLEGRFRVINWEGRPAIQSTVIDITERRNLERQARAEHERLMDAMESISDGVVLLDKDDRFVLCNSAFRKYLEKIDDVLVPGSAFEAIFRAAAERNIFSKDGKDIENFIRHRMKAHKKRETIIQRYAESGGWFIVSEYKTSDGGTFIVRTDITESKKAEDALRSSESALRISEARFMDIAESASDHFWEMGPDLRYNFISEKFFVESSVAPEEIIGKTRMEYAGAEAIAQNPGLWKAHEDDLKNHRPFRNFEYSKKLPSGRVSHLSVSGRPFFDEGGKFLGYRGASTDITEYRRTERELTQHNKMESLGYLAGGMAHNLNNMLQPILIMGHMTKDNLPVGSSERQNLEIICQAGQNASELVERIAAFSRQKGLDRKSADIFKVIRQGLDFINPIIPKSVTVHENLDKKTGRVYVDAVQVQTVLMNLAANAVDAMGEKKGELRITLAKSFVDETPANAIPGLSKGNYAKLTVADTGHGMDEGTLSRIFDPFYTTKELDKGTGLGLSSAFGTIYKHRGTIRAVSAPGIGTAFDVYLPLEKKT
ncbi:MAG: PAS-domain containing protein [Rhodospirillales bacterium]|nr:PAS-domain containing protein [Rhodospirillales bacterium]